MSIKIKSFPKELLPPFINQMIETYLKGHIGDYNFIASSMLTTYGASLGNNYEFQNNGWIERPNLWLMYVAPSGKGKSHQLDDVILPVVEKNNELMKSYNDSKERKTTVTNLINELTALQKKDGSIVSNCFAKAYGADNYVETFRLYNDMGGLNAIVNTPQRLLFNSFTFPAILRQLQNNKGRNVLIAVDEGKKMFEELNKHSSGDEETFLELFGYGSVLIDRKGEDLSSYVESKMVSIIVTTQTSVIPTIFNQKRKDNGNMYRWLFVTNADKESSNPWDKESVGETPFNHFKFICEKNLNNWENINSKQIYKINDEIRITLKKWRDNMNDVYRTTVEEEIYDSIMGKMDSYVIRLAIILNRLWAEQHRLETNANDSSFIMKPIDFERAGELCEWYFIEHLKATRQTESILSQFLSVEEIKMVYDKLEPNFKWSDFSSALKSIGFAVDSATYKLKKLINNKIISYNERDKTYRKLIF